MDALAVVGPGLPAVARRAILAWLGGGGRGVVDPAGPRASVFVTLRSADGSLRGCVGSLTPVDGDVATETARCAVHAATRDLRFPPVRESEVVALSVEVSVLGDEEPITDAAALEPALYGLVVRDAEGRCGVLLPGLPGIDDGAGQIEAARKKAEIPVHAPVRLARFRVTKWVGQGA